MRSSQGNKRKYHYDQYSGFNQQKHSSLVRRRKIIARIMLTSRPLKTIFQHKACTVKLYADSFYKVQKNSHSSFEVICCRS